MYFFFLILWGLYKKYIYKFMIHRNFLYVFLFCVTAMISVSCKDDQYMPTLNTKPGETVLDDNSPKTTVGVDQVFDFKFDEESATRTFVVGQENATGNTHQKPIINWKVGDKYRFYAVVRYVNLKDQSDWRPNFSNDGFYLEILSYDKATRKGKFKIKGNIQIKSTYIDTSGKLPKLRDQGNWYFGGFIGGKLSADGSKIVDDMGISKTFENTDVKGIAIKSPKVFTAVSPTASEFNLNIPFGVPLEHIELSGSNQNVWMNSLTTKPLELKPIGNLLCIRLKNELVHSVAISNNASITISSKFLLDCDVTFGLWYPQNKLSTIGTSSFAFKYDVVGGTASKVDNNGYRNNVSMTIDWSQYKPNRTKDTKQDVVLRMNETVNLYVWSVFNTDYNVPAADVNSGTVDLDFTNLGLRVPEYTPVNNDYPQVEFKPIISSSKVKFYGGVDASSNTWQDNYPGLNVDYLRKTTGKFNLNPSSSIVVPFSIKSDLYISEIYFSWKSGKDCYSILEIFNPNSTSVDLSNYFLLRIVDYPGLNGSSVSKDKTILKFWGPDAKTTDRFQNAYLMPLDFATKTNGNVYAFTPAGYAQKNMVYYDANRGNVFIDNSKQFKVSSLLYAPAELPTSDVMKSMPPGFCFCLAGHGVYKLAEANNRGLSVTGLFDPNELGGDQLTAFQAYTHIYASMNPQQYGKVYGVIDGAIDVDKNPSSTARAAGSMVRDSNEGWALVKLINGKFYIIDSFGPTFNTSSNSLSPGEFKEMMNQYRTDSDWNNASMWFNRKQNVVFPNGGVFEGFYWNRDQKSLTEWNIEIAKPYQGQRIHTIGSRARYYDNAGRITNGKVPYLFGIDPWK